MKDDVPLSPLAGTPDPRGGDCVDCGRCCHHGPSTVHLLDTDEARMLAAPGGAEVLRRLTVLDPRPPGWRFVRNTGERCAALDVSTPGRYPCGIYEVRPDDCRIVEPGSPACLEARRLGHLGSSVEYVRGKTSPPGPLSAGGEGEERQCASGSRLPSPPAERGRG